MKKVLHVITNFAAVGGAEMMLSRLIQAQPDCQHYVVALMQINQTYHTALQQCTAYYALHWNGLNTLQSIFKLRRIIRDIQPDVIQGWMYHANVLTTLSTMGLKVKPPVFWGIHHSLASPKEESLSTKVALQLSRYLSGFASGIIYCAQSALQQHQAFGFRNSQQCVIPNGIEIERFQFHSVTEHSPLVVGFAGRFHPAKGYPYLVKTIAQLRGYPLRFKIAGRGANLNNPELAALFEQYQVDLNQVELLDQVEDMPNFYASLDLLLMTSITEGFPNVLVEAMASGVPCITTDVGDAGLIVADTGYVVPPRDATQMAASILQYLELSVQEKQQKQNNARSRVEENFTIQAIRQIYLHVWNIA